MKNVYSQYIAIITSSNKNTPFAPQIVWITNFSRVSSRDLKSSQEKF